MYIFYRLRSFIRKQFLLFKVQFVVTRVQHLLASTTYLMKKNSGTIVQNLKQGNFRVKMTLLAEK